MDCDDSMRLHVQGDKYQTPLAAAVQAAQGKDPADPVAQALTQEVSLLIDNSITKSDRNKVAYCRMLTN